MAFVPHLALNAARPSAGLRLSDSARPARPVRRASSRVPLRMVATEPMADTTAATSSPLTDRAVELMSYLRAHKSIFSAGDGFNSVTATLFRKNDTARVFTPVDELDTNSADLAGASVASVLMHRADELLDLALDASIKVMPTAASDLTIQEILRHDIATFVRVISYAVACQSKDFLHDNNFAMMKMLHDEVHIPSEALVAALTAVKTAILADISDQVLTAPTAECFDIVCARLA